MKLKTILSGSVAAVVLLSAVGAYAIDTKAKNMILMDYINLL